MKNINTKDLKRECENLNFSYECLKCTCEYWKSEYEDLKSKYEDLENKCDDLKKDNNFLNLLLDYRTEEKNENTKMKESFINSLLKTNTLSSKQKTYLMYDDETQKFMIGKSNDPYKTEKELCLYSSSIYMVAYCDYDIESVLHSMISENIVKDEWFNLSTKQVRWIIDYFGMKATNRSKLNEFYDKADLPF